MAKQTITAVFDTRDHAESAGLSLRQAGIPASDVTLSPEDARDEFGAGNGTVSEPKPTGFMASLENMFGGYDDRDTYAEGVRRGGTLLTAHVDDAHIDRAVSLLEQHGAIDLEEREETWRGEGWTGGRTGAGMAATGVAGAGAADLAMTGAAPAATAVTTDTRTAAMAPTAAASARTRTVAGEDVLQVVEERLDVGKRAVSRGKVRLHSYVVENQVSENVNLRDETVTVDRRVVDRPVAALGADAFQERTIEMEEFDEEAVVAKTAHVVEEIGIRKDVTDRVETVRDTVRSTKVDVEDSRTRPGCRRARDRGGQRWRPDRGAHGGLRVRWHQGRHGRPHGRPGPDQARQEHVARRTAPPRPDDLGGSRRPACPPEQDRRRDEGISLGVIIGRRCRVLLHRRSSNRVSAVLPEGRASKARGIGSTAELPTGT